MRRILLAALSAALFFPAPSAAQRTFRIARPLPTLRVGAVDTVKFEAIGDNGRRVASPAGRCLSYTPTIVRIERNVVMRALAPGRGVLACAWMPGTDGLLIDTASVVVAAVEQPKPEPEKPAPPADPKPDPEPEKPAPTPDPDPPVGGPKPPPVGDAHILLDLRAGSATDLQRATSWDAVQRWFTEASPWGGIGVARNFDGRGTTAFRVTWPGWGGTCRETTRWVRKYPLRAGNDPREMWASWRHYFGRHPNDAGGSGSAGSFVSTNPNCGTGGNAGRKLALFGRTGGGNEERTDILIPGPSGALRVAIDTENYAAGSSWRADEHTGQVLTFVVRLKAASAAGRRDGIVQVWVNGQLVLDRRDVPGARGFRGLELPSVFNSPRQDQTEYVWDLVVWTPEN